MARVVERRGARRAAEKGPAKAEPKGATGDRRRSMRFPLIFRVDYTLGERPTFNYATDLSLYGLYLRNTRDLEVGQRLELTLNLKNRSAPLVLLADVRRVTSGGKETGAGVEFVHGQEAVIAEVREYLERELVSKLEASVARSLASASAVAQLASYYVEVGRAAEALELCQRAIEQHASNQPLYELLAGLVVSDVEASGAEAWPRLAALEDIVARGLALGASEQLLSVQRRAQAVREQIDRRSKERQQREEEERRRRADEESRRIRDEIAGELKRASDAALAAHKKALDDESRERNKADAKELAAAKQELARSRADLEAEREAHVTAERALAKREQKIERQEAKVAEREAAVQADVEQRDRTFETRSESLDSRALELKEARKALDAELAAFAESTQRDKRELAKREKELERRAEKVGEAEHLAQELASSRAELQTMRKALTQAERHAAKSELAERAAQDAGKGLEQALEQAQRLIDELRTTIAARDEEQARLAQMAREEIATATSRAMQASADVETEHTALVRRADAAESELAALLETNTALRRELEDVKEQGAVAELHASQAAQAHAQQVDKVSAELDAATSELSQLRQEHAAELERVKLAMNATLDELRRESEQVTAAARLEQEAVRHELNASRARLEELERDIQQTSALLAARDDELARARENLADVRAELERTPKASELEALQTALAVEQAERQRVSAELSAARQQMSEELSAVQLRTSEELSAMQQRAAEELAASEQRGHDELARQRELLEGERSLAAERERQRAAEELAASEQRGHDELVRLRELLEREKSLAAERERQGAVLAAELEATRTALSTAKSDVASRVGEAKRLVEENARLEKRVSHLGTELSKVQRELEEQRRLGVSSSAPVVGDSDLELVDDAVEVVPEPVTATATWRDRLTFRSRAMVFGIALVLAVGGISVLAIRWVRTPKALAVSAAPSEAHTAPEAAPPPEKKDTDALFDSVFNK